MIGLTLKMIDSSFATATDPHGIGTDKFPAPQATLMATIIKGVLSQNLDWSYLLIGAGLSLAVFLCGVSPLAWAVGVYLPIGTTLPIFIGGMIRGLCDKIRGKEESEISTGMLFATGLVAGGTLTGVFSALLKAIPSGGVNPETGEAVDSDLLTNMQKIGEGVQEQVNQVLDLNLYSLIFYGVLGFILVGFAMKRSSGVSESKD